MAATNTLQTYLTECRFLLHDATSAFYSDSELTTHINAARDRLARDTGCLRSYQTTNAVANQESYNLSTLPNGQYTFDVLNINLIWGNTRVPMRYLPFTQFNAELRFWQNYIGRPICFTTYTIASTYYIAPVPDQNYSMELDTLLVPVPMVNATDVDTIQNTMSSPIAHYACHLAKFKEQAYGEAEIFKQQYKDKALNAISTSFQRRIPNPYSTPY
jgi:hypothetical protein